MYEDSREVVMKNQIDVNKLTPREKMAELVELTKC